MSSSERRPETEDQSRTPPSEASSDGDAGHRAKRESRTSRSGDLLSSVADVVKDVLPEVLEDEADQPLHSLLESTLDILFSPKVRDTLERQTEEALARLLDSALVFIDDRERRRKVQRNTEQQLRALTRDMFDEIFVTSVRIRLERPWNRAINEAVGGDFGAALKEGGRGLEALFPSVVEVLQQNWGRILQVLLQVAFVGLQESLESAIEDGLASAVGLNQEELSDQVENVRGTVEDKGQELQKKLEDAFDELRKNVEEGKQQLEQRVKEGVRSAVSGDGRYDRGRGWPPYSGPANGRPPNRRPPSGRPPSARPPSRRDGRR